MQKAFGMLEILFVFVMLGILISLARPFSNRQLERAREYLYQNLLYAKNLALTHSTRYTKPEQGNFLKGYFPSVALPFLVKEPMMWQMQFHLVGKYTKDSFSIYFDTPRYAHTTHYDHRPMSGDLIAVSGRDLHCISGYNNNNISEFCKDNADTTTRLKESFGIHLAIHAQKSCQESQTARIYFDFLGRPYCGREQTPLKEPFIITLSKNSHSTTICILPKNGLILKGEACQK
ncbi:pilus assembly FimT family protein [Helicobacter mustelae]|uniref:Type II secretion system protein n=1 Tax=Helicobacter mustelae (strain ATCC 43772 / CCUG 25715 / CIP 103759 / LMG 18044 / NCTC 12198 / R85-136P) TaxID=679897 RepID=D3UI64_HELM1|nr:type II secretion system protein [Helicobacter mustelae]CBG40187.1 Putative hypothetical protein [Helicobacter mustelae 12198]SQH71690.1 Uncharacterised protein [Helicobacter mustelae]STP12815.1 Uncharacterised protein [Helicobacter mustelae]